MADSLDRSRPGLDSAGSAGLIKLAAKNPESEEVAGLSVIIPVAEDPAGLTSTLESLKEYDRGFMQIIVCNDGGHESIRKVCSRFGVESVDIVPNGGSYKARNAGIRVARYRFFAFLDADVVVCPNWFSQAMQVLNKADYVAANIIHPPAMPGSGLHFYQRSHAFQVHRLMTSLHFGPTAHLLVRRRVFEEVGLFDERLRASGDRDFGWRVWMAGSYTQVYDPSFFVIHPYRDLKGVMLKCLRICMGLRTYAHLHPERKAELLPKPLSALRMLFPRRFLLLALLGRSWSEDRLSYGERLRMCLIEYFIAWVEVYGYFRPWRRPDLFEWDRGGQAMRRRTALGLVL